MKFTPQQQADIDRQKAADPAARHLTSKATPEQAAEIRNSARQAETQKAEIEEEYHRVVAASEEEGFSGWLRRAIRRAKRPVQKLAGEAKIEIDLLRDFRVGDATLPSDAVDRLVAALDLTLVEEPAG